MKKVFIIAEAGVNHNGSIELAKKLVDAAVDSGADAVKFQTFKAASLVSQNASKADYQQKTGDASESQYDMLKKLELSESDFEQLYHHCKKVGIGFLSSGFCPRDLKFLNGFQMDFLKILKMLITEFFIPH